MCTITLSYDGNNAIAREKLEALIQTGLFKQLTDLESPDESIIREAHKRVMQKDIYTPDEAYELTMKEIKEIYQLEYAV